MKKRVLFFILLSCICFIQCTRHQPSLLLVHEMQAALPLDYDTIERGPTRLAAAGGDTATVMLYYLCSVDSTVKRKRLSDGAVTEIYRLQGPEYSQMAQVAANGDTVFLFMAGGDIVAVTDDWTGKFRLPKIPGKTFLFRVDDLNVHNGKVFIQYSVPVPPNFIDKYVDAVIPLQDTSGALQQYCGAFPEVYAQGVFYYTNADRTFRGDDLYYLFEKSDSLMIYDAGSLGFNTAVSVFTDIPRSTADKPYDAARARDFVYLKEYITISECNIRTYQYQDTDQLYMIKRLPAREAGEPVRYVLGKVRNKEYIGYAALPEDFDAGQHYLHNNTLFYVSTLDGVWYRYRIEEISS